MAMSRSIGGRSFTTLPSMLISPEVISSSPATMRSVVVLPQPDGPDQHHELLVADLEVDVLHRVDAVVVLLVQLAGSMTLRHGQPCLNLSRDRSCR